MTSPEVVAFRPTRLVVAGDIDVDTLIVHGMFSDGQSDARHAKLPCSLGNLLARLPPGAVIMRRCEIGKDIGFELENKADHEQEFCFWLLGHGFKE